MHRRVTPENGENALPPACLQNFYDDDGAGIELEKKQTPHSKHNVEPVLFMFNSIDSQNGTSTQLTSAMFEEWYAAGTTRTGTPPPTSPAAPTASGASGGASAASGGQFSDGEDGT